MISEILAVGLIVSASLAIYLEEAIYSVASLSFMFLFMSILYSLNGASIVAIFQLALGVGTLAVLFLSGEMLSKKTEKKRSNKKTLIAATVGLLLSLPTILFSVTISPANISPEITFAEALWGMRAMDMLLQGLVIMTVALGIAVIFYENRRSEK